MSMTLPKSSNWPEMAGSVHRVDNRRMAYLRALFRQISIDDNDAEARSLRLLALSLFVGNPLITAEHDRRSRRDVIDDALDRLLSSWRH